MPESLLKDCMQDAAFDEYTRLLASVLRHRPHTLPAEQETLLAGAGELANAPSTIYTLFTEADLTFPDITGEDGQSLHGQRRAAADAAGAAGTAACGKRRTNRS